jgi:hypothetical protein
LHVQSIGLNLAQIATFLSGDLRRCPLQFPLGLLSDRLNRQVALIFASSGASAGGGILAFAPRTPAFAYTGSFLWSAVAAALLAGGGPCL